MSNEVAIADVSAEQRELIKRTVAKDATTDELQLYFYDCKRRGVHPLDKKIHFTKRSGKYVPIVGIDFLREQAAKTGQCVGISDPIFSGELGDNDFSATVTVKRLVQGVIADFTATARWSEYCPAKGQDHMWVKMGHTMLGKCAEALALRKGFPGDESGSLYIREEMDQAMEHVPIERQATQPRSIPQPPARATAVAPTQDFPPNTPLVGLLKQLIPADGAKPAIMMIEMDGVGTMSFDVLKGIEEYAPLLNHMIEFKYGKNGKFRPITSVALAPTAPQAPLKTVPGPTRTAAPVVLPATVQRVLDERQDDDDQGPPQEAYFEAGQDCVGLVIKVEHKESRDRLKKWAVLTLACVNGDFQAKAWSRFDFASLDEVLDKQVWFKVFAKEFRGAMEYTIDMLELYNKKDGGE